METTSSPWLERNEFLIRRLHSLSGLVPVGAYMVVHLFTNAAVLGGAASFQQLVDRIHSLGPLLPLVEWTFIFIPILFHAVVGVAIARGSFPNTDSYPYTSNIRYRLQRVTAWIALVFIFLHVFHLHGWIHSSWWLERVAQPLGGAQFEPERATTSAAMAMGPLLVKIGYAVGVLACVYHLANGLWSMGITWGVWTTPAAQRRADVLCGAFGVGLAVVAIGALVGMSTVDIDRAEAYEQIRLQETEERQEKTRELEQELKEGEDRGMDQRTAATDPAVPGNVESDQRTVPVAREAEK